MNSTERDINTEINDNENYYGSFMEEASKSSSSFTSEESEELENEESNTGELITLSCSCKNTCSRKRSDTFAGCPCKTAKVRCSEICKCGTRRAACKNMNTPADNATERTTCCCKNTCSRTRSEKYAGCPCKTANIDCCERCKCGTTKSQCKNKTVTEVINRNPSAFSRHQEQVEEARIEIEAFVQKLSNQDKDALLITLLTQGRGSLQFAKDMLTGDAKGNFEDNSPGPSQQSPWCICGVCRNMPLAIENKCCGKRTCFTSYEMFHNICIDREVLTLAIRARFDIMAEDADYSSNSFRKSAYRQYCLWKYGKLGRGNRRVLPSCVVLMIRQAYPAADGLYMGYRES